jgi:ATP-dependent DNA helicase RecQ
LAEKENVPAYIVLNDASLLDLANQKPTSLGDLLNVTGFGEFKIKKYGNAFVKEIKQWLKSNEIKLPKQDTYKETLNLLNSGFTLEEIAVSRQLHESTIYSHIAHLYKTNQLNSIDNYINQTELAYVRQAVKITGEKKLLGPIFTFLKEEIPHHIIRLGLAYLEKEEIEALKV